MKVLSKGRTQKGWSKQLRCSGDGNGGGGCSAILLVEQPDLYHTYKHSYDGSSDTFTSFTCCDCGVETDIEDVPSHLELYSKEDWLKLHAK